VNYVATVPLDIHIFYFRNQKQRRRLHRLLLTQIMMRMKMTMCYYVWRTSKDSLGEKYDYAQLVKNKYAFCVLYD